MNKLQHVFDIRFANNNSKGKVHIAALNGNNTLCNKQERYLNVDGTEIDLLTPTKSPVNCMGCTKALELSVRNAATKLDATQLEQVLYFIRDYKNGN